MKSTRPTFTREKNQVQRRSSRPRQETGSGDQLFDNLDGETLLTADELAARLGVATWTIRKWRYEGYLPADTMLKLRHSVRYRWSKVLRWLSTRRD